MGHYLLDTQYVYVAVDMLRPYPTYLYFLGAVVVFPHETDNMVRTETIFQEEPEFKTIIRSVNSNPTEAKQTIPIRTLATGGSRMYFFC